MHIDELRQWRQSSIETHLYAAAELVGDKILALTKDADDAYWLAQVYYASGEYLRGAAVALNYDTLQCKYIAALCYIKALELDKALEVLSCAVEPVHSVRAVSTSSLKRTRSRSGNFGSFGVLDALDEPEISSVSVHALLLYLKGQVYTLQACFGPAKESYIAALRKDPRCFDAFHQLVKHHALQPFEEWSLLNSLDFHKIGEFGTALYSLRLSKLQHLPELQDSICTLTETYGVDENTCDILCAKAEAAHASGQRVKTLELCEKAIKLDPYCHIYPIYLATLYSLRRNNDLYKVVSELATRDGSISHYAVGMYYLSTSRVTEARRHFSEASLMDPGFAPAWLAFAQTFAQESEHEQAVTAYSTVAKLFPGYYLPLLCIGIQHLQLYNLGLAEKYFLYARKMCGDDPYVFNELGVCYYRLDKPQRALSLLEQAAKLAEKHGEDEIRNSVDANRGYVYLKLQKPALALTLFEKVARNAPLDQATCASIGLCQMHMQNYSKAVEWLAQALTLGDDPTISDLLKSAVARSVQEFSPVEFARENKDHIARSKQKLEVP